MAMPNSQICSCLEPELERLFSGSLCPRWGLKKCLASQRTEAIQPFCQGLEPH